MIVFSELSKNRILSGKKTRVTRFIEKPCVEVGDVYRATTCENPIGNQPSTALGVFAMIKIVAIRTANFVRPSPFRHNAWTRDLEYVIGYRNLHRHAEKSGYETFYEFREAYKTANEQHIEDATRKHYIIDFGVVGEAGQFIKTKFQIGDYVSWVRQGEQKYARVLDIEYSEFRMDWIYKLDSWVNDIPDFWDWEMEKKLQYVE